MEHADLADWAEVSYELQPGFRVQSQDDHEIVVEGTCPRCNGTTTWPFTRVAPDETDPRSAHGAERSLGLASLLDRARAVIHRQHEDLAKVVEATIVCSCGHEHGKRPSDAQSDGCGAYWKVQVRL